MQSPIPIAKREALAAAVVLALVTAFVMSDWFLLDRMPGGDFPGYVASLDKSQHWLAERGRIPSWCPECYGGTSVFTSHLKEILASPLVWMSEPVVAAKLAFAFFRWLAALGIFACFARLFAAPTVGVAAGVVYAFGSWSNHEIEHLEVAFAAALLPPFLLAAVETLRGAGRAAPIVLGALAAGTFSNSWIQALIALALSALLLWLCPFEGPRVPPRQRWRRVALAGSLAILLSASSLAWMAADAPHHRLFSPEVAAQQREVWSLRSPLLLVNRDGVLADWLNDHPPPGPRMPSFDTGQNYLGIGVLAIASAGWFIARRQRLERRWYQLMTLLLLLQLNLASGPYVALQQLGIGAAGDASVQLSILLASLGLGVALLLLSRRLEARGRIEAGAALLALVVAASFPLYESLAALLPPLQVQRSPGHFAALVPFPLAFLFGLGLRALARIPEKPAARAFVVAGLFALVLVDAAPSRGTFSNGHPLAPLRATARRIEGLEREDASLRIALTRSYAPLSSYLVENAGLGFAWGWLPWQSGTAWSRYVERTVWMPGALESTRQQTLLGLGRIRYFLLAPGSDPFSPESLPPPWTLRERSGDFEIWEQSEIRPYAALYPSPASGRRPDWVGDVNASRALAWTRPDPGHIRATLPAEHLGGWVFVSESHHPWWRARADGEAAEVILAEPAFLAVRVGANAREVSVRFEPPPPVVIAEWLTALTGALVLLLLAGFGICQRRVEGPGTGSPAASRVR